MPPTFRLFLLGNFQLTGPDGDADLSNKKVAGLLAYLALTAPKPQPREKLATVFWGSYFEAQARQNLRQALFRLRRILGEGALVSDGESVTLAPGAVDCDAVRFDALVRSGSLNSLADAAALYADKLLADVVIEEEGWTHWLTAERRRLEALALDTLVRVGEADLSRGDADKALARAIRALTLDELREDAHRLTMRALAAAGRKAEALKHYRNLVGLLQRELATDPDSATRQLVAELERAQTPIIATPGGDGADRSNASPTEPAPVAAAAPATAAKVAAAPPAKSERRQLTVMVCNLAAAPDASKALDPEDVRDRMAVFHSKVAEVVAPFGGHVAQYLGDGAHVYFGYPVAHEDDAEQAVRAALALRDASASLSVRIGIATGLVVIDDEPGAASSLRRIAVGETPNEAVLLQSAAAPGDVVITHGTLQIVGRIFDCRRLGDESGHGSRSVEGWLVRTEKPNVSRFDARRAGNLSALVGRQEELDLLMRRWAHLKSGEGRVVLVSGEPGIGKSRLIQEFKTRIVADRHLWIECGGAAFLADIPFQAVSQMLSQGLRWHGGETVDERYTQLEQSLGLTGMKLDETVPLIAELLGQPAHQKYPPLMFSADQRRKRLLSALTGWVFSVTQRQPVVMIVEDLHWVDPSTLELLQVLSESCAREPLLLLSTARPELRPPWPMRAHHAHITLNRLNDSETRELVAGITMQASLAATLVDAVVARADGVPLFVEELTRLMLDGAAHAGDIPATLHDSLTARLDRLGPARQVAQLGAVLGRDFAYDLLAAVAQMPAGELDAALTELVEQDLVYGRGKVPHSSYQFKHALVQDAAYQTLLKGKRKELHASVAKTIEESFPALADAQPQMLAGHWTEAGNAGKAFDAWLKAAKTARARHAFVEAGASFRRARALLQTLPASPERDTQEQGLLAQFGLVLNFLEGNTNAEMIELIARYHTLAEKSGHLERVIGLRFSIYVQAFMAGNWAQASVLADQLTEFVEHVHQGPQSNLAPTGVRLANYAQFITNYYCGNVARAEQHFTTWQSWLSTDSEESNRVDRVSPALAQAALCSWHIGQPDLARSRLAEAMAHATDSADPWSLSFGHMQEALLYYYERDPAKVEAAGARAVAMAKEKGFTQIEGLSLPCLGWALAQSGRHEEGLAHIRKGIMMLSSIGSRVSLPIFITMRGEAEALIGDDIAALATFDEALNLNPDEQLYAYHTLLSRAQLLGELGACDEAEANLRSVLELSRRGGAKACELRALARMRQLAT